MLDSTDMMVFITWRHVRLNVIQDHEWPNHMPCGSAMLAPDARHHHRLYDLQAVQLPARLSGTDELMTPTNDNICTSASFKPDMNIAALMGIGCGFLEHVLWKRTEAHAFPKLAIYHCNNLGYFVQTHKKPRHPHELVRMSWFCWVTL